MKTRSLRLLTVLIIAASAFGQTPEPRHAYLKSIVLPGWGESAYGSGSAYVFMATELALWAGFGGLHYSAAVQNRDLIAYSRLHAGISVYPDSKDYWSDLGNFSSWEDHRETMLENRTPEDIWDIDFAWEWDSALNTGTYRELFRKKELTLVSSEFVIAGMIVNRIASVINIKYLENKRMQIQAYAAPVRGGAFMHLGLSF